MARSGHTFWMSLNARINQDILIPPKLKGAAKNGQIVTAEITQYPEGRLGAKGRIIEVHIGTLLADQAFTFTDWTAEMKAKASICISQPETLIESLEIAKSRIKIVSIDGNAIGLSALVAARLAKLRSAGL